MLSIFETETNQAKFEKFDSEHPEVYAQLVRLSYEWVRAGHRKLGIATLWERLRWEWHINGKDDDGFKLNNNYKAFYARKIMAENPALDGLFETRIMKAA